MKRNLFITKAIIYGISVTALLLLPSYTMAATKGVPETQPRVSAPKAPPPPSEPQTPQKPIVRPVPITKTPAEAVAPPAQKPTAAPVTPVKPQITKPVPQPPPQKPIAGPEPPIKPQPRKPVQPSQKPPMHKPIASPDTPVRPPQTQPLKPQVSPPAEPMAQPPRSPGTIGGVVPHEKPITKPPIYKPGPGFDQGGQMIPPASLSEKPEDVVIPDKLPSKETPATIAPESVGDVSKPPQSDKHRQRVQSIYGKPAILVPQTEPSQVVGEAGKPTIQTSPESTPAASIAPKLDTEAASQAQPIYQQSKNARKEIRVRQDNLVQAAGIPDKAKLSWQTALSEVPVDESDWSGKYGAMILEGLEIGVAKST